MTDDTGPSGPGGSAHAVLGPDDVARALRRMAHEIVERHHGSTHLLVVGIQRGGADVAAHLATQLGEILGTPIDHEDLDVSFYRDDIGESPLKISAPTTLHSDLRGRVVVLVDDVLFTGRTVRAALNALLSFGRPDAVDLAVLVDRGHRELPLRADYVGKNLPTSREERVIASLEGVWIERVS
ncbi:MAG: bifunctional pyr operon transcriptional regulator/uracil phosphoribosyltransferase PyrR [Acidobacteria bacterium]|nr:bifunctional pyr operon transcriptional regulator/uracil phosphoribosyltransferase PyrR [Acidobacteriota bacterium]